ncbi:MAG: DUF4142 domain-containing protein [Gemmatimonadales bacterium]
MSRWKAVAASLTVMVSAHLSAQQELSDVEMAHVAVTASLIDIRYAHLALALSDHPGVREFAQTMIRDHEAVNAGVAALAARLGVKAQDNAMSQSLLAGAAKTIEQLSRSRGAEFDRAYMTNELAYHQTVNGAVERQFLPNIQNAEVRKAFADALQVFRGHERHASALATSLGAR